MASKSYVTSLELTLDSEIAALEASKRAAARAGVSAGPLPFAAMPAMPAPGTPAPPMAAPPMAAPPMAAPPMAAPPMAGPAPLRMAGQSPRGRRVLVVIAAAFGLLLVLGILLSPQMSQHFSGTGVVLQSTATVAAATAVPGTPAPIATPVPTAVPSPANPAPGISSTYIVAGAVLLLLLLALVFRRGMSARATTGRAPAPLAGPPGELEALDLRIARLGQIREWLQQDTRLRDMVDDAIRHQVLASERRQKTLSVVLSVASLGVGWLLSPINPLAVMAGFLHR